MSYGIAKEVGGDSPENVAKMEERIKNVSERNAHLDPEEIIKICKSQLWPRHGEHKQGGM